MNAPKAPVRPLVNRVHTPFDPELNNLDGVNEAAPASLDDVFDQEADRKASNG